MHVVVTGGAGFIGSHVVELLVTQGHEVTVLDNLSTGSSANLQPYVRLIREDVRADLKSVLADYRPDALVHLAAQVSVPRSVVDPLSDLSTNVYGTANIFEAAARTGVQKVIFMSSAAVYGYPENLPLTEDGTVQPMSPYGLSKRTGEEYVRLLGEQFHVDYTILRPSNVYGPRQTTEGEGAVIPSFLRRFAEGVDPIIHGDGLQTRDFLYVGDAAAAIVRALHEGSRLTLNLSSGKAYTILDIWRELAALLDWKRPPVFSEPRAGDIPHSILSNERICHVLKWEPKVSIVQGLTQTVEASQHMGLVRAN